MAESFRVATADLTLGLAAAQRRSAPIMITDRADHDEAIDVITTAEVHIKGMGFRVCPCTGGELTPRLPP